MMRPRQVGGLLALTLVLLWAAGCASSPERGSPDEGKNQAQIYLELGTAHLRQGKPRKALEKLKEARSLKDDDPRIHNVMGLTYQRLGFDQKAQQAFEQALGLDAKNPQVLNNFGTFLAQNGSYERARKQFRKALEDPLYNRPENAYYNLAWLARRQGEADKAEEMLRTALELRAEYPPARLELARLLRDQGRPSQARDQVARLLGRNPESVSGHLLAGELALEAGEDQTARKHLTKVAELAPESQAATRAQRMMEELAGRQGS
ncbi:type IV pilus biogenesis/stability protein PilW [Thiohalorhabdus sp.]|uniref:type IV pilus biogenesis/stability protein PilW n=1 Tax=Thiohalorhabdus sp. TaxID=3094134 RepID=UPI002FC2EFBE